MSLSISIFFLIRQLQSSKFLDKLIPNNKLIKDPKGYVVFIGGEGKQKFWSEILKERWSKISPLFKEKVLFVNRMNLSDFISLSILFRPLFIF